MSSSMRLGATGSRYYYRVRWNAQHLSWKAFQDDVVGAEDPRCAPTSSLRGSAFVDWRRLTNMGKQPSSKFNGIQASASPFEGLAQRVHWLNAIVEDDPFGKQLIGADIDAEWVEE